MDDWQTYPDPLHFAILPDLHFYEKMRQMDIATMEGVINVIRIWKLGQVLPNGTVKMPSAATIAKLKEMLDEKMGGGTADIIWDSMIELDDHYPPVDKILGSDKYVYVKDEIKAGFGIPDILITGKGQGSYSQQYLGVKVLVEKLEYVREKIKLWLMKEVYDIMAIYGWTEPPMVRFECMNLRDEATVQRLLIELADRNLISKETLLKWFNESWTLEATEIKEEKEEEKENKDLEAINPHKTNPSATGFADPDNGRPEGSTKKQEVKRDTKAKGS